MVYSEIIENVHIELVLHTDCKKQSHFFKSATNWLPWQRQVINLA